MDEALTFAEIDVLDLLKEATAAFYKLAEHHPTDCQEWSAEVHALQHRVMSRAAIRAMPNYFLAMPVNAPLGKCVRPVSVEGKA